MNQTLSYVDEITQLFKRIDLYLQRSHNTGFADRLRENKISIENALASLSRKQYTAAFIGKISVGKTSAICKIAGLQYSKPDDHNIIDLLKTGSGRTTVCEVHIEYADKYSIKVEVLDINDIHKCISTFAEFIWAKSRKGIDEEAEGGNILSQEIERCIRNMLRLKKKPKDENGKLISIDKAIELADTCGSISELIDHMFNRFELEKRTQTELWFNPESEKAWQDWIKESFAEINDGKNRNISIPSKIMICGPFPLKRLDCAWKIIDSRGVDSNPYREDIRKIIDTEGIFPVICSSFGDAPDAESRSIIKHGIELNHKSRIERDTLLLILDKNESPKVPDIEDEETDGIDIKRLGRQIREDIVTTIITNDYKINPNIKTFDSHLDSELDVWNALEERKQAYLKSKLCGLNRLILATREMLDVEDSNRVTKFNENIRDLLNGWRSEADSYSPEWCNYGENVQGLLRDTHHKTIAASIYRKGHFDNFDIYECVNQKARIIAKESFKPWIDSLIIKVDSLKSIYPDFENQIDTLNTNLNAEFQEFAIYVGSEVKKIWIDEVEPSIDWQVMKDEWGRGSGYKHRILEHWKTWTESELSKNIHDSILVRATTAWGRVGMQCNLGDHHVLHN